MLSPLKGKIEDEMPTYIKLDWGHRSRWSGNRCLWILYRTMRNYFSFFWFFYVPFVALSLNFIVPYFVIK